jgi:hypothetical protein
MQETPGENDMANSPFDANPAFTKLGEDSRKAVIQAFDAMSNWRAELAEISEKNSDAVFDKMSEAAKALGWPTEFVELSRKQMQNASRMQLQAVDQVMGLWENQAKALGTPGQFPGFPNMPGFGSGGGSSQPGAGSSIFPGMPDLGSAQMAPIQFWMQAAEMWQKGWQQAMSTWMDAQQSAMTKGGSSSNKSNSR